MNWPAIRAIYGFEMARTNVMYTGNSTTTESAVSSRYQTRSIGRTRGRAEK